MMIPLKITEDRANHTRKDSKARLQYQVNDWVALLENRSRVFNDSLAFSFLNEKEEINATLSYRQIFIHACIIAECMQEKGIVFGDRALLVYSPGLAYIPVFFACLMLGVIAVPAYPAKNISGLKRLANIAQDAKPFMILSEKKNLEAIHFFSEKLPIFQDIPTLDTEISRRPSQDWCAPDMHNPKDIAFLQYSSGSTSSPKGIMVSHENLLYHAHCIHERFHYSSKTIGVSWLPQYHDMGFIGAILQTIYEGGHTILFAPSTFLAKPLSWLYALSRFRGTTSGAPNFAYELCIQEAANINPSLDLSSWEIAYSGAEPVRANTMKRFYDIFKKYGFALRAFKPTYGLAEATLIVSTGLFQAKPSFCRVDKNLLTKNKVKKTTKLASSQVLVACGSPLKEENVVIVHPKTLKPCLKNEVGEIWVNSKHLPQAYFGNKLLSRKTFQAKLANNKSKDRFLRTGDLGFILDKELYYVSRLKDLIIIHGQNYFPEDLEFLIESSNPAILPAGALIFSAEKNHQEAIYIMVELQFLYLQKKEMFLELTQAIRHSLLEHYFLPIAEITLLKPGTLPRTTSGKKQRRQCQILYNNKELQAHTIFSWCFKEDKAMENTLSTSLEKELCRICSQLLNHPIAIHNDLFDYHLDSILAVQLCARIQEELGLKIAVDLLLDHHTVAKLAQYLQTQKPVQEEKIAKQVSKDKDKAKGLYPLSFAEQRLWFLDRLEPGSALYTLPALLQLDGNLDIKALQKAMHMLMARHDILRTSFVLDAADTPKQKIKQHLRPTLKIEDVSHLKKKIHQYTLSAFQLNKPPLLRMHVFKFSNSKHYVLFLIHHIIADAWSLNLIAKEFSYFYNHLVSHKPLKIAPLELQYADFSLWQRKYLRVDGDIYQKQKNYWLKQLHDAPPLLDLPLDKTRPKMQNYVSANQSLSLSQELTESLKDFAKKHKTTLFTVLLSAFFVLLSRYSGQKDIIVGSPFANRTRKELEPLIGFFVNTLPLRANLKNNPSVKAFLQQIKTMVLGAHKHQDYPFETMVEQLQISRSLQYHPMFQVLFVLQNTPEFALDLNDINVSIESFHHPLTAFDIKIEIQEKQKTTASPTCRGLTAASIDPAVRPRGVGLELSLDYASALFSKKSMRLLLAHFQTLLSAFINNEQTQIFDVKLLAADEENKILYQFNQTDKEFPKAKTVHQLFEEQVSKTPNNIALVFENKKLSYAELNQKANEWAHFLIQQASLRGAKLQSNPASLKSLDCFETSSLAKTADMPIAICMERSVELIIAILAVLKSGAAYVPLDPNYPELRLDFMLQDAGCQFLLTQTSLLQRFSEKNLTCFALDSPPAYFQAPDIHNPIIHIEPTHLAYIIYTSGSTGVPKGVAIPHQALVNFLSAMGFYLMIQDKDRCLASTTISFDIAGLELYLPLSRGACVYLVRTDWLLKPKDLKKYICENKISLMQATPSTWNMLLENMDGEPFPRIKILSGGEALSLDLAKKLSAQALNVWNLYGPTETTIWSTIHLMLNPSQVSIGKPIFNTKIYILDEYLNPCPIGVPGELYIAGAGLARGYFGRARLTAEHFIANPFASLEDIKKGQTRMYKTGDICRWTDDGKLIYQGRIDHQIKIRGFRIELQEIEQSLEKNDSVQKAIVLVQEQQNQEKTLVAYIKPKQGKAFSPEALSNFLQKFLPDYMLPSFFIAMDALALLPNGKIDRKAFKPAPFKTIHGSTQAPNEREQAFLNIWKEVLQLDEISVLDNFFEIGGHSLVAVQLINKINKKMHLNWPVSMVFTHESIEKMAKASLAADTEASPRSAPIVPLKQGEKTILFCIHPLNGQIFCYQTLASQIDKEYSVYALEQSYSQGDLSIAAMANSYVQAIQSIQKKGPYCIAGWSMGGLIAHEVSSQLESLGNRIVFTGLIDTPTPKTIQMHLENRDKRGLDLKLFVKDLWGQYGQVFDEKAFDKIKEAEKLQWILKQAQKQHILSKGFKLEAFLHMLKQVENNRKAMETYQPTMIHSPLTLFQAKESGNGSALEAENFWQHYTEYAVKTHVLSGNHYSLLRQPHVAVLSKLINAYLTISTDLEVGDLR